MELKRKGSIAASPDNSMLAVVDVQEKLTAAMPSYADAERGMALAIQGASVLGVDRLVTEQYPRGLGRTVKGLRQHLSDNIPCFAKTSFSCWGDVAFAKHVEAVRPETLVLIGVETHVCIQQTALQAAARGFRVVVPADAVCSRRISDRDVALNLLRERGVVVTTIESLLFDWVRDASHPQFKAISRLVAAR